MDFEKELQKFDFFDVDEGFTKLQNEVSVVLDAFNTILRRLGVEQNKTNIQLEEIFSLLDEEKEKSADTADMKRRLETSEKEKLSLVKGFIAVLDLIEDLYRYSLLNGDGSWTKQFELLWNTVSKMLLSIGIIRIEGENTIFNQQLNSVKAVENIPDIQDRIVLEVIRCGYIYKSVILRKAEVVVNRISEGGSGNDG